MQLGPDPKYKNERQGSGMLKAAFITDIHYGPDTKTARGDYLKKGSFARFVVNDFVEAVNKSDAQCVLNLGDNISAYNDLRDHFNMALLQHDLGDLNVPLYYTPGNNEQRSSLDPDDIEKITGRPYDTYSKVIGGVHFVFWNPGLDTSKSQIIQEKDLKELKATLDLNKDIPAVVCTHIPLDNNRQFLRPHHFSSKYKYFY